MTGAPLLEIENLTVRFPAGRQVVRAAEGVSLAVERGSIVGLIGESGSGKTTVARAIVGLNRPTGGDIRFEGTQVLGLRRRERKALLRRVQFVFQDPFASLDPRMRVGALIAEPLVIHRIGNAAARKARVADLLERVGLPAESVTRFAHQFSGGQRQRIAIARALAAGPDLLIADEPIAALDVSVQAQILNLLAELRHDMDLSMLMVAHDLEAVAHLCDRVVVMYLGHVVESGPTSAVWGRPRHPYTRALIEATPRLARAQLPRNEAIRRPVIRGETPSPIDPPEGCVFRTRCAYAEPRCAAPPPVVTLGAQTILCHRPELFA